MQLRAILIAGTVFSVAAATVVVSGLYLTFQDVTEALKKSNAADDIARPVFELTVLTGDYLLRPGSRAQVQWERRHQSLGRLLTETRFRGVDQEPILGLLRAKHVQIGKAFGRLVGNYTPRRGSADQGGGSPALQEILATQLQTVSLDMVTYAFRLASDSTIEMEKAAVRAVWLVLLLIGMTALSAAGMWLVLALRVVRPLGDLRRGIEIVGGGNFDHRIGSSSKDEIGEVARSFDQMTDQLNAITVSRDELAQEVNERKRAEQELRLLTESLDQRSGELETANRELDAFAYSVSHDLRAPLRSMDGFSQALVEDFGDRLDAQGRDFIQRIRGAAQRMGRLIDDLLTLSRITRAELRRTSVDLSAQARRIAADLQEGPEERQVEFVIADGLTVDGDSRLLHIAIDNLIGNAWKFTARTPSARIEVGSTTEAGETVYFVRDNGAGFDMAYADKLFGAFQRLHAPDEFPGTGIGLATVQRVIRKHGGKIWAEGRVGQGATFYFDLWS